MDCSPPDSPIHGIFQGRILEQAAISFSRESFWPSGWTQVCCVSCFGRQILYYCTPWEAHFFHSPFTFYSYLTSNIIPGGPVSKSLSSQCRGHKFNPYRGTSQGTKIPRQKKLLLFFCLTFTLLANFIFLLFIFEKNVTILSLEDKEATQLQTLLSVWME